MTYPRRETVRIRSASFGEAAILCDVECLAAARFRDIGMERISLGEPTDKLLLGTAAREGRLLTADIVAEGRILDKATAFLLSGVLDSQPHILELNVKPSQARKGIGRQLIAAFAAQAVADRRNRWITLTTFRDVPWNAPYYRRLGFEIMTPADCGPALSECLAKERERLPAAEFGERVAMRRAIRSR